MASFTQNVAEQFPAGTTVGAFKQSNWPYGSRPPLGAPLGSADTSAVVAADGTLRLALTDGVPYFLTNTSGTPGSMGYARTGAPPHVPPPTQPTIVSPVGSFTPDCDVGTYFIRLTGNLTINAPINAVAGSRLWLYFVQDATGGRQVTWDSVYTFGFPRVSLAQFAPTLCNFVNMPDWDSNQPTFTWIMEGAAGAGQRLLIGQNNPSPNGNLNMTFSTGYSALASRPPAMYADWSNTIHLSGELVQTAAAAQGVCTLPLGYFPVAGTIFVPCMNGSTSGVPSWGFLQVQNSGALLVSVTGVARTWFLDGITYEAGS